MMPIESVKVRKTDTPTVLVTPANGGQPFVCYLDQGTHGKAVWHVQTKNCDVGTVCNQSLSKILNEIPLNPGHVHAIVRSETPLDPYLAWPEYGYGQTDGHTIN